MKSSHQLCLEVIAQTLQHAAGFQLHAAKHKVLVIRDALACCDALLLKIDHLLDQAFVFLRRFRFRLVAHHGPFHGQAPLAAARSSR